MNRWKLGAGRVDRNQNETINALRRAGCLVHSLAQVGNGCPDLLVLAPDGRLLLLEIKDGTKPHSAQRLTPKEAQWHRLWGGRGAPVYVVNCVAAAMDIVAGKAVVANG
jgi:hypothetical protein